VGAVRGSARGLAFRRFLWKALARLPEFRITRSTRHGILGFSNRDRGIGRDLFLRREYEYDEIQRAVRLLDTVSAGRRRWVVDVGANVGSVCIALVREGRFAAALAVEPAQNTFRHLVKNVARNGLSSAIRCVNVAASATNGTGDLELSRNSGDHRVRVGQPVDDEERYRERTRPVIPVPVRRLDDLLVECGVDPRDVGLLWMDVQGHEPHVLEGAPGLLATGVPLIIEIWPYGLRRAGIAPAAFVEHLAARFECYYDLTTEAPAVRPTTELPALLGRLSHFKAFANLLLVPR
jgi:FkbM family methyltransferase